MRPGTQYGESIVPLSRSPQAGAMALRCGVDKALSRWAWPCLWNDRTPFLGASLAGTPIELSQHGRTTPGR